MAEHHPAGPAELGAPMDYDEHERTYSGFLMLTKVGVVATIATLIALALFAFGGGWGFWWGTLMLVLTTIATVIAMMGSGSIRPLVVVSVFGLILMALTAG